MLEPDTQPLVCPGPAQTAELGLRFDMIWELLEAAWSWGSRRAKLVTAVRVAHRGSEHRASSTLASPHTRFCFLPIPCFCWKTLKTIVKTHFGLGRTCCAGKPQRSPWGRAACPGAHRCHPCVAGAVGQWGMLPCPGCHLLWCDGYSKAWQMSPVRGVNTGSWWRTGLPRQVASELNLLVITRDGRNSWGLYFPPL